MTNPQKPDLTEHEEETIPLDDVLRRLLEAKPVRDAPKPNEAPPESEP